MAKAIQIILLLLALSTFGTRATPARADVIDEVHFSGVTIFTGDEIQNIVEIQPGSDFGKKQIERTIETVKTYYQMKGYEQAQIAATFPPEGRGKILEFIVDEGLPTRVANVRIEPLEISTDEFERYWAKVRDALGGKVGVRIGDVYDQEKLSNGKRQIQDALAVDDFIGARVLDVRVESVSAPTDTTAEMGKAGRWVDLTMRVSLGDRISFGFRDNTVFNFSALTSVIQEQRIHGMGTDYIATLTGKFKELYLGAGYPFIKLETYVIEKDPGRHQRHVTFQFSEGPRVLIDSIRFDGNIIFEGSELKKQFLKRASVVFQSGYYVEKDIQAAGELLREWMSSQGYLGAKIVTIETKFKQSLEGRNAKLAHPDRADLLVYLYEGEQTRIRSISLSGNQALSDAEVKSILTINEEAPLNLYSLTDGIEALKQHYRNLGYLGIRIVNEDADLLRYGQENRAADIEVRLEEGPLYRASRIQVEGLQQTKELVVRQQLEFREGEVLEETKLAESEKNLRRLGIFSSASIRLFEDTEQPGFKVVKVVIQEGTPGVLEGGIGFRNDLGLRLFGQIGYDDLWGENHSASLSLIGNRRFGRDDDGKNRFRFAEYEAQATYIWPWFVFDRVFLRPIATSSRTQYLQFDSNLQSVSINLDRRLFKSPEVTGTLSYSAEFIEQFNAPASIDEENQRLALYTITPALRLDTRDNPLSPTSGWYVTTSTDFTLDRLGSHGAKGLDRYPMSFIRFQTRTDRFFDLGSSVTLYLSGRFGYERNFVPPIDDGNGNRIATGRIPLIKQFSLGGVGSMRGFREQGINYFDEAIIVGSLGYSNYRMQVDLPFTGAMKFGPFIDAGTLTKDHFSFGGLRYGAGAGMHYQTPVGPVNFDWGFNLDPKPNESPYEIYFSIGVI